MLTKNSVMILSRAAQLGCRANLF